MKHFTYIARDRSGAVKKGAVAASDRSEALARLKAMALIPISVSENGQARSRQSAWPLSGSWLRRAVWFIPLAVVLFVIVRLALPQKGRAVVAERLPAATKMSPVAERVVTAAKPPAAPAMAEDLAPSPVETINEVLAPPVVSTDQVASPPKEKTRRMVSDLRPGRTNSLPSGLSSGSERVLNAMFTASLGGPPPPLLQFPPNEATNLVAVLSRDIVVFDDDDEATVAKKTNLAVVKQKLKEYLQEGGKAEDFMVYYRDILKQAYEERVERQKAYNALRMSGDEKAANEYFESANRELAGKGYLPLSNPPARRPQE